MILDILLVTEVKHNCHYFPVRSFSGDTICSYVLVFRAYLFVLESRLWESMVNKNIISSAVFVTLYLKIITATHGLTRHLPQSMWKSSAGSKDIRLLSMYLQTKILFPLGCERASSR